MFCARSQVADIRKIVRRVERNKRLGSIRYRLGIPMLRARANSCQVGSRRGAGFVVSRLRRIMLAHAHQPAVPWNGRKSTTQVFAWRSSARMPWQGRFVHSVWLSNKRWNLRSQF